MATPRVKIQQSGPEAHKLIPKPDTKGILDPRVGPTEEAPPPSRGSFSRSFSSSFSVDRSSVSEVSFVQTAFYNMNMFGENQLDDNVKANLSSDITIGQGASAGQWNSQRFRTPSSRTGPGRNNQRTYIYYESSFGANRNSAKKSIFTIDGGSNSNSQIQAWLNSSKARRLVADVCLQGSGWNALQQGMYIWSSDTAPINFETSTDQQVEVWLLQHRRLRQNGWEYSDSYEAGNRPFDYVRAQFTVVHAGGWRRVTYNVPDNHQYVGMFVDLEHLAGAFRTDAAITRLSFMEAR